MRTLFILALIYLVCLQTSSAFSDSESEHIYPPFAFVELFTSEGCSSCPPADRILSELTLYARHHQKKIYTLSYHVDYWNHLGWVDRFSHEFNTQRQKQYRRALMLDSLFTPQVIINGSASVSGANGRKIFHTIEQFLGISPSIEIDFQISNDGEDIYIDYRVSKAPSKVQLNIALVERGLTTPVSAGENAGRALKHDNVVRVFRSLPLKKRKGRTSLKKPANLNIQESSVIVFLQDPMSMQILSAGMKDL